MVPAAPRHPSSASGFWPGESVHPDSSPPALFSSLNMLFILTWFPGIVMGCNPECENGSGWGLWPTPTSSVHGLSSCSLEAAALRLLHPPTPVPLLPGISSKNVHRVYLHLQPTPRKRPRHLHLRRPATPRTPEPRLCKWSLSLFRWPHIQDVRLILWGSSAPCPQEMFISPEHLTRTFSSLSPNAIPLAGPSEQSASLPLPTPQHTAHADCPVTFGHSDSQHWTLTQNSLRGVIKPLLVQEFSLEFCHTQTAHSRASRRICQLLVG